MSSERLTLGLALSLSAVALACHEQAPAPAAASRARRGSQPSPPPRWQTTPAGRSTLGPRAGEACQREDPPRRERELGRLEVASTEVSQAEFEAKMGFNPSYHVCADCPVDSVTFDEAAKFCNALSVEAELERCYRCASAEQADGVSCAPARAPSSCSGYRLPSSDEWEHFARAGSHGPTYAGPISACMAQDPVADRIGWYKANSGGWTHRSAELEPNAWGLFDTAGNVSEWVDASAESGRRDFGLLAGGSWYHNAEYLRAASRLRVPHERRLAYAGFRCVRSLDPEPELPAPLAVSAPPDPEAIEPEPATVPEVSSVAPEAALVAALAFTSTDPAKLAPGCRDSSCAIEQLVRKAAAAGAALIVTPEYALEQYEAEPTPKLGDLPARELPAKAPLLARFAQVADEVDAYVLINLQTLDEDGAHYNTVVAFDPAGAVVGRHHKFELYGGERDALTPGSEVSSFDTPFGRVGLLTCADIYGRPRLHDELINGLDARIVAWSAEWTVAGARRWQSTFARDWKVFLVAANGARGAGEGAGVYAPDGESLERRDEAASILYARLPAGSGEIAPLH